MLIAAAAAVVGGWFWWFAGRQARDPELVSPALALRFIGDGKSVFDPGKSVEFAQAARDPRRWRQLDRIYRFDVVLLKGIPALYRPLCTHFAETGDWILAYVDHVALVYRRAPARRWEPGDIESIRQQFAGKPKPVRVVFLTQLSARLIAAGEPRLAEKMAQEALVLDGSSAEVLAQLAVCQAAFKRWSATLESADAALAKKPGLAPALFMRAQALYALGKSGEALAVSTKLLKGAEDDAQALFLHARIAHEARAFGTEVDTLKRLIDKAEREGTSTSGFRVYLGQALAKTGDATAAVAQFQKALDSEDLTEEQRQFAREALDRLQESGENPAP